MLAKEEQLSEDYQVCDNIDLDTVLLEYLNYYYARYNKYPKICKKVEVTTTGSSQNQPRRERIGKNIRRSDVSVDQSNVLKGKSLQKKNDLLLEADPNFGMTVTPIFQHSGKINQSQSNMPCNEEAKLFCNDRVPKPIGDLYQHGSEWREMADIISREIVQTSLNVHWDDIQGLEDCKAVLKEAMVYPMKYPKLFEGKLTPWQGVLLYGPPGTGKTMLAKAVATMCNATFFNITSSSIVSKWRGDSEKYIRVLCDLAKHHSPAVIFIDEIDWIASGECSSSKSEPARRFRAEILARLDGLLSMESPRVLLLATSNVPWELDVALLRRLEKRILVDLPDCISRSQILQNYVQEDICKTEEFSALLQETEGYSCADLKLLCKEAWMMQLRPILKRLENCDKVSTDVERNDCINKLSYLTEAMVNIKPTAKHLASKYRQWNESYDGRQRNSSSSKDHFFLHCVADHN